MNTAWEESVVAMVTDLASMPASTFSKYWRGAMIFLDWLVYPPSQVCCLLQVLLRSDTMIAKVVSV